MPKWYQHPTEPQYHVQKDGDGGVSFSGANRKMPELPFSAGRQIWVRAGTGWSLSSHRYQSPLFSQGSLGAAGPKPNQEFFQAGSYIQGWLGGGGFGELLRKTGGGGEGDFVEREGTEPHGLSVQA